MYLGCLYIFVVGSQYRNLRMSFFSLILFIFLRLFFFIHVQYPGCSTFTHRKNTKTLRHVSFFISFTMYNMKNGTFACVIWKHTCALYHPLCIIHTFCIFHAEYLEGFHFGCRQHQRKQYRNLTNTEYCIIQKSYQSK